jgi:beta-glucosidase
MELQPGETRMVRLNLDSRAFAYWDVATHRWMARAGIYRLSVGGGSDDIRLSKNVLMSSTGPVE